jgi:enoyl-CoA hydratase
VSDDGGTSADTVRVDSEPGPDGTPGAIRVISIDRPGALNAIDVATMRALGGAFRDCASAPHLRAVILTGAGDRAFAAGADIAALSVMGPTEARAFSALGHEVAGAMESLSVPVIAAVNGFALGGGCEMALGCDFIYAADTARFGMPESKLGAIPGFGGTVRLVERIGPALARELLFSGDVIDAAEALRIGLVNRVFPPARLLPEARRAAAAIAARAPLAIARLKEALAGRAAATRGNAGPRETEMFASLFATADLRAGMQAFVAKDKQPPKWQGR